MLRRLLLAVFITGLPAAQAHGLRSGYYAGFNAGFYSNPSLPPFLFEPSPKADGGIFGFQFGYMQQYGPYALGLEFDISKASSLEKQSLSISIFPGSSFDISTQRQQDWIATARLRGGYLVDSKVLLYATAGLATAQTSGSFLIKDTSASCFCGPVLFSTAVGQGTETQTGVAVGAGLEFQNTLMSSIKLEYLHYDLGRMSFPIYAPPFPDPIGQAEFVNQGHIVRIGFNFRFGE